MRTRRSATFTATMVNPRWQVRGYRGELVDGPRFTQNYDGGNRPPRAAQSHMVALLRKDGADCTFAEIVDRDGMVELKDEDGRVIERKFLTVMAVER